MTSRTYTNRSNAVRAAKSALGASAMSDVHFRIEPVGEEFAWIELDLQTGLAKADASEGGATVHHVEVRAPVTVEAKPDALDVLDAPTRTDSAPALVFDANDPLVVGGRRYGNATRAAEARKALEAKAAKVEKANKPKAEKAPSGPSKADALVEAALRDTGVTPEEIRAMTGWTKLGGFYGAVKRAGHALRTLKEMKTSRWFAEPKGVEGHHAYIRRVAGGSWERLGVFADKAAALAAAPEDFAAEVGKDGEFYVSPRAALGV